MRRASSSSLPAAVSKRHRSPLLDDRERERESLVADRQRRRVAVARDRVLRFVRRDKALAGRPIGRRVARRHPFARHCRATASVAPRSRALDRLHERARRILGRRECLLRAAPRRMHSVAAKATDQNAGEQRAPTRAPSCSRRCHPSSSPSHSHCAIGACIQRRPPPPAAATAAAHAATAAEIARRRARHPCSRSAAAEIAGLRAAVGVECRRRRSACRRAPARLAPPADPRCRIAATSRRHVAALDRLATGVGATAKRVARSRVGRLSAPVLLRDALVAIRHAAAMVDVVPPVVVAKCSFG